MSAPPPCLDICMSAEMDSDSPILEYLGGGLPVQWEDLSEIVGATLSLSREGSSMLKSEDCSPGMSAPDLLKMNCTGVEQEDAPPAYSPGSERPACPPPRTQPETYYGSWRDFFQPSFKWSALMAEIREAAIKKTTKTKIYYEELAKTVHECHTDTQPRLERRMGLVVAFDKDRGFGFIKDYITDRDLYVNRRSVKRSYLPEHLHNLREGEGVEFTPAEGLRGPYATAVSRPKKKTEDWDIDEDHPGCEREPVRSPEPAHHAFQERGSFIGPNVFWQPTVVEKRVSPWPSPELPRREKTVRELQDAERFRAALDNIRRGRKADASPEPAAAAQHVPFTLQVPAATAEDSDPDSESLDDQIVRLEKKLRELRQIASARIQTPPDLKKKGLKDSDVSGSEVRVSVPSSRPSLVSAPAVRSSYAVHRRTEPVVQEPTGPLAAAVPRPVQQPPIAMPAPVRSATLITPRPMGPIPIRGPFMLQLPPNTVLWAHPPVDPQYRPSLQMEPGSTTETPSGYDLPL